MLKRIAVVIWWTGALAGALGLFLMGAELIGQAGCQKLLTSFEGKSSHSTPDRTKPESLGEYQVTAPDGKVYKVTGPVDAADEQLIASVKSYREQSKPATTTADSAPRKFDLASARPLETTESGETPGAKAFDPDAYLAMKRAQATAHHSAHGPWEHYARATESPFVNDADPENGRACKRDPDYWRPLYLAFLAALLWSVAFVLAGRFWLPPFHSA